MLKSGILSVLFLCLAVSSFSQENDLGQKEQYKGQMKNVQFEYFKNWVLDDGSGALTITPDGLRKIYIEIHREVLERSVESVLKEIKDQGEVLKETKFNGYKAYEFDGGYFLFIGNVQYDFLVHNVSKDEKLKKQLEYITKSFKIK